MKSEKGITLTSLIIYIIVVLIVVGILATITSTFQSNIKEINKEGTKNAEIDKFNVYFLKDVKKQGNGIGTVSDNEIVFTMGNKYTFKDDNCIYFNDNIKIAESIENCKFSDKLDNGKTIINITIKAKNSEERNLEYVLSNEAYYGGYEDESGYTSSNASLPNEYKQIEYIESTGVQYIDTGVIGKTGLKLETKCTPSNWNINEDYVFIGSRGADGHKFWIDYGFYSSNKNILFGYGDYVLNRNFQPIADIPYTTVLDTVNKEGYIDGSKVVDLSNITINTNMNLYMFVGNYNGNFVGWAKVKMYYTKIYDGDNLIRDYIPVLDKNNVVCLYDRINQKFYYNQGTDEFIPGPQI